jgi:hypothetical protein
MSLERRYARLLGWYPEPFRSAHAQEVLAVLMAGAGEEQRRPRLREYSDVVKSAVGMRLRGARSEGWVDALALFSFLAPLFVLVVYVLEVAFPYHAPVRQSLLLSIVPVQQSLLGTPAFRAVLIVQVVIAALVLAGLRWVALAAVVAGSAACVTVINTFYLPGQLKVIAVSFGLLEAAALIAAPGPRRGRHLVNWGHGVVLLLLAAAVQVSAVAYQAAQDRFMMLPSSLSWGHVAISGALAAAALVVAVFAKLGWRFLLLLAALCYAYALLLATTPAASSGSDLIGSPTPIHLALLFLPSLLLACATVITAVLPKRRRIVTADAAHLSQLRRLFTTAVGWS